MFKVPLLTREEEEKANQELKKFVTGKNVEHFQRLLKLTTIGRRKFIESEALTIKEILKEYPILSDYEMVNIITFKNFFTYKNVSESMILLFHSSMTLRLCMNFAIT